MGSGKAELGAFCPLLASAGRAVLLARCSQLLDAACVCPCTCERVERIPVHRGLLLSLRWTALRSALFIFLLTNPMSRSGRGGTAGSKFRVTLGLPTYATINCADNTGAKNLYVISVHNIGGRLNRLPSAGRVVCSSRRRRAHCCAACSRRRHDHGVGQEGQA